jgi:hypothetical protein
MGMKHDLGKLMANPVAVAKSSRTSLRWETAAWSALKMMRVSSEYWRTGQGRSGERGWPIKLSLQAFMDEALKDVSHNDKEVW